MRKKQKNILIKEPTAIVKKNKCFNQENTNMYTNMHRFALYIPLFFIWMTGLFAVNEEVKKPNIVVIFGDDIGQSNLSIYTKGLMGYRTPNIDRIAEEGLIFTDYYAEQSCTAGRAAFITGQSVFRSGLSKVGLPGADQGFKAEDPTIAELLKPLGYATAQFGKNHLEIKMNICPQPMDSMSFMAISII